MLFGGPKFHCHNTNVYEQVSNRESVDNLYQLNMCSYVAESVREQEKQDGEFLLSQ
jgi:hypothetical protein